MQAQLSQAARVINYDNDRGPLTLSAAIVRKGKKLPKPKSPKYYNAQSCRREANHFKYPDDRLFSHQILIERQSPLYQQYYDDDGVSGLIFSSPGLTEWYVAEFCKLNHFKR
jgi:hypothetical protein